VAGLDEIMAKVRADRLVALLLLLQRRGRITAAEAAAELETSERTARRDLEALGRAGLPVYSQQGRQGGWFLAGGGRTDLSGLSAPEVRALFMVAGPASPATPDVRSALRKLTRAIPQAFQPMAESAATALVVDPNAWDRSPVRVSPPPWLDRVQAAVVDAQEVELGYVSGPGVSTTRVVQPLGLAVKGVTWYLLADTAKGRRTFRVDRISALQPTGNRAQRPEGFDLGEAWTEVVGQIDQHRTPLRARAVVDPAALGVLRWILGTRLAIGPPDGRGRVEVELRGQSERTLAGEIAGLGSAVEVLEPVSMRHQLSALGRQLATLYGEAPTESSSAGHGPVPVGHDQAVAPTATPTSSHPRAPGG
jgi:predicted DNA-binding transcriptional regulator YafY